MPSILMSIPRIRHLPFIIIWMTFCKLCACSAFLRNLSVSGLDEHGKPVLIAYLFQVFHELARHLQTRRLIAGDSISLDQDRNFYCVIDGTVQVFAHAGTTTRQNGSWEEEDMNGYQLINEVGSGGTLSSLFSILSLFTDEVKLSWQDDSAGLPASRSGNQATSPRCTRPG